MAMASAYDDAPWKQHFPDGITETVEHQPHASIPALAAETARLHGDRLAFTTCMPNGMSGSLRFREVEALSDGFAAYLREDLGLAQGARVAVQMPNCLSYPVAVLGILKAGCVLVNVNPLYTPREMSAQFRDSEAEALVIIDLFLDKLESIISETSIKHVVVAGVAQWFPPVVGGILRLILKYWQCVIPDHNLDVVRLDTAIERGRAQLDHVQVTDYWHELAHGDTALLQYTGGTTGVSKGAVLTHGNLLANLAQVDATAGEFIEPGSECVLTALPLYHIFAFTVNFLAFYMKGAHNVLVPSPRPIRNCQRALENYPISWISGVNTLYNAVLNEEWFALYPPPSMKMAMAGGTALHHAVAERWTQIAGCPIVEGYGLTETSPVLCFNPIRNPLPDSIGIPVPGTRVRLIDEQGECVPPGEPGELIVQGPQVMTRYWNRPEETERSFRDGWFCTGDIAVMDENGYFRIVDRKKDLILVSGFNVYPNEVEDCIARLDAVQESAVIGVPDRQTGEAVHAYVVLRAPGLGEKDIREHCRSELAAYKVPSRVVFAEDLPKTPVGKVLRKDLRDRAQPGDETTPSDERVA